MSSAQSYDELLKWGLELNAKQSTRNADREISVLVHRSAFGLRTFQDLLRVRSFGSYQSLFENRAEAEVRERVFKVGVQPLEHSHVRIGHIFHREGNPFFPSPSGVTACQSLSPLKITRSPG